VLRIIVGFIVLLSTPVTNQSINQSINQSARPAVLVTTL
jgi:hypothetical protein